MASSGPPVDNEHGNVPLAQFRTALKDIKTIIGADARTFSKKRAEKVEVEEAKNVVVETIDADENFTTESIENELKTFNFSSV